MLHLPSFPKRGCSQLVPFPALHLIQQEPAEHPSPFPSAASSPGAVPALGDTVMSTGTNLSVEIFLIINHSQSIAEQADSQWERLQQQHNGFDFLCFHQ